MSDTIGLIAGSDRFPLLLAERARAQGHRVVAVALHDVTSPEIVDLADAVEWVRVGQLDKLIGVLKREKVDRVYMAGAVCKADIFHPRRAFVHLPDVRAMRLWFQKLENRSDETILAAVAEELTSEGIDLRSSVELVEDQLASEGCMTRREAKPREFEDARFGWSHVRELARLDIGQTIIVKDRCVVAVEAVEGTDECIRRGARLAGPGAVLVKASRPSQDMRFDVPCVGVQTVEVCSETGVVAMAVEAGKTLIIDRESMIAAADAAHLAIIGMPRGKAGE